MNNEYRRLMTIMEDTVENHAADFIRSLTSESSGLGEPLRSHLSGDVFKKYNFMKAFEEVDDYERLFDHVHDNLLALDKVFKTLAPLVLQAQKAADHFNESTFTTFDEAKGELNKIMNIEFNLLDEKYEISFLDRNGNLVEKPVLHIMGNWEEIPHSVVDAVWDQLIDRNGFLHTITGKHNWSSSFPKLVPVNINNQDSIIAGKIK